MDPVASAHDDVLRISELTPDHPAYVGNRPVFGADGMLPEEWLAAHDLSDDQVEVYRIADAVVVLPSRSRAEVSRFFAEVLDGDTYARLVADSDAGAA